MTETPRLSLRQLSYFVKAVESGSLGAAAEFLGVSPSTLSEAISELEGHLGSQLMLRRKGLGAVLTPFGSEILPQARALLSAAAEIQTSGGGVGRPLTGRLVIGCMSSIAPTVLPPLIVEFGNLHPGVNIEFVEGSQIEIQLALDQGRCEAAILYDDGDLSPMFRREVLYTVEPKIFLSPQHRLSGAEAIGLRDLEGEPFIMVDIPPSRENIKALFRSARVTPNIRHVTESLELARALVARGLGYSIMVQRPATNVSYEGLPVTTSRLTGFDFEITVILCSWATQPSHRLEAFFSICRQCLRHSHA
jgi:DNA-binding transcriptional LysR family regulator